MIGVLELLSWVSLVAGSLFCIIGALGLFRMPDVYTRIHAASVIDTLGMGFILLGLLLQVSSWLVALKLIALFFLIFFASPTATHALAKAALTRGLKPILTESKSGGVPSKP